MRRPPRTLLFGRYLTLVLAVVGAVIGVQAGAARAAGAPIWSWPLAGQPVVDRPFQPPASAWGAGHRGVDLRGGLGEAVLSAGPGRVTYAGLLAGRGVVTVTHANGLRTTYEPVEASVASGAQVERADVIGTLSSGHGSCRPGTTCLHWGLLRGETYLDPLGLVVAGHLRLLPLGGEAGAAATSGGEAASGTRLQRRRATTVPAPPAAPGAPRPSTGRDNVLAAANVAAVSALASGAFLGTRRVVRRRRG